jgi:hypothetical protein
MEGFDPEVPLTASLAPNGYPLLDVRVGPGRPSTVRGFDRPASGSFPEPESCQALIDTGAEGCSITAGLKERLNLLPQQGKITEIGYAGTNQLLDAYSIGITMGGVFYCQTRAPAVMVPGHGYGYQIVIGCNVLRHCTLTYDGTIGQFTLHVPRAMGLA